MNKELPWYESVHMLSHIEITISKQNDIIASLGRALFSTHQNKTPPLIPNCFQGKHRVRLCMACEATGPKLQVSAP